MWGKGLTHARRQWRGERMKEDATNFCSPEKVSTRGTCSFPTEQAWQGFLQSSLSQSFNASCTSGFIGLRVAGSAVRDFKSLHCFECIITKLLCRHLL